MTRLADLFLRLSAHRPAQRFARAASDPVQAQAACLAAILQRNAATEFGREHGFAAIRTAAEFRRAVPVQDYEQIRDRVHRMMLGETGVLTAEPPLMFARTSGTTGDAKFIPVTSTCRRRSHKEPLRTWFHHALQDHPGLFQGRVLTLVSPAEEGRTKAEIPYGATSGHIYKHLPLPVRRTYLLPYELFELSDYEARYALAMRLSVGAKDVSFLATANPSTIVELVRTADQRSERILKDVADGTIDPEIPLPLSLRNRIEAKLRPDPSRARNLERARNARGGALLPRDYWPQLRLIGCWKGGTVGAHVQRFAEWFGDGVAVRDLGYLSSEARVSVPMVDLGSSGALAVGCVWLEFVLASELEAEPDARDRWTFLGVDEVEVGREYYIFLTTTGGLYRYDINDIVEVTGRWRETPLIAFRRKGRGMTSLTGEKLSVNQVIEAVQRTAHALSVVIDHFKAEADPLRARYVLKVESARGIDPTVRKDLLRGFDRTLGELNLEYRNKRDSRRLGAPVLWIMAPGWYEQSKRRLVESGKRLFQAKTIILSERSPTLTQEPVLAEVLLDE